MKEPLNAECRLEFGTILKIGLHCRFFTASFTDITFTKEFSRFGAQLSG